MSQLYSQIDYENNNVVPWELPKDNPIVKSVWKSTSFMLATKMIVCENAYVFEAPLPKAFRGYFRLSSLRTFLDPQVDVTNVMLGVPARWTLVQMGIQDDQYLVECYTNTVCGKWKSVGFSMLTLQSFDMDEWCAIHCLAARFVKKYT